MFLVSDEGVYNEPGEARQTAGAGPHRRQGELEFILAIDLKKMFFDIGLLVYYIHAHCCAL